MAKILKATLQQQANRNKIIFKRLMEEQLISKSIAMYLRGSALHATVVGWILRSCQRWHPANRD